jgi:hypothetical protein
MYHQLNCLELYTDNIEISKFSSVICYELNIKNFVIHSTANINKVYKPNRGEIGKQFKKHSNDIIHFINNPDKKITPELVSIINNDNILEIDDNDIITILPSSCYIIEYQIDNRPGWVASRFYYSNHNNITAQSVIYLDTVTTKDNEQTTDMNYIRRQINDLRKNKGYKLYNKVEIIFDKNNYWNQFSTDLLESLKQRLSANVRFDDKLETYDIINSCYNNIELKVNIVYLQN